MYKSRCVLAFGVLLTVGCDQQAPVTSEKPPQKRMMPSQEKSTFSDEVTVQLAIDSGDGRPVVRGTTNLPAGTHL